MPFRRPKKGEKGEAALYISRNQAIRYLQLKLPEFRKLTVWKGVYPREPKSRKRAQKGDTSIKTLYLKEDIKFLAADPIIWKLRDEKIHRERVKSMKETDKWRAEFVQNFRKPKFVLDHMILERYPNFGHALEDMSDPLNACFIYGALPNAKNIDQKMVHRCRKLTSEFLNFVIESQCLRCVFISVKGYYYRAIIKGHKVDWMIPHNFSPQIPDGVDMRNMGNFIQFYVTFLSFVNFKLYATLNLRYPPRVINHTMKKDPSMTISERRESYIWSLNTRLQIVYKDEENNEEHDLKLMGATGKERAAYVQEQKKKIKQKILFKNVKFFLGRETNRESLTVIIRSAGGLVSWNESVGSGAAYLESDKDIKYQIVDRPEVEQTYMTRYYVQPQWVYDSFNAGLLMPVQDYFVGAELPAHLSPFEETYKDKYVPPEMTRLQALKGKIKLVGDKKGDDGIDLAFSDSEEELDDGEGVKEASPEEELKTKDAPEEAMDEAEESDVDEEKEQNKVQSGKVKDVEVEEEEEESKEENEEQMFDVPMENEEEEEEADVLSKMSVKSSVPYKRNRKWEAEQAEREDWNLRSTFIHRKQKRLFKKLHDREKETQKTADNLKKKRILYEKDRLRTKKLKKKQQALAAQ